MSNCSFKKCKCWVRQIAALDKIRPLNFITVFNKQVFSSLSSCHQDKQQTPSKRAWEGIRKTHSPPSWVRKDLETVVASPLEMQTVEWEKTSATIPLVGQEIMDLQTEVWSRRAASYPQLSFFPPQKMLSDKQADTPHTLPCSVFLLKRLEDALCEKCEGGGVKEGTEKEITTS